MQPGSLLPVGFAVTTLLIHSNAHYKTVAVLVAQEQALSLISRCPKLSYIRMVLIGL